MLLMCKTKSVAVYASVNQSFVDVLIMFTLKVANLRITLLVCLVCLKIEYELWAMSKIKKPLKLVCRTDEKYRSKINKTVQKGA